MVTSIAEVLDFWKEADATKQIGVTVPLAELRALVAEVEGYRQKARVLRGGILNCPGDNGLLDWREPA